MTRANPKYVWYSHVDKLARVLERVADGEIRRLMIFMPPRHGKSELVSRLFAAYYLTLHPARWVGITSYGADLAFTLSRAARDNYQRAGGRLREDSRAVHHWETGQGGGMWAAGAGGPITGKGFHLGIIDDPLKDAAEAASETIREKHKEWYRSTFYTREEPGGAIIIIQTRWHQDDLSGWLLAQEELEEPERWHIVSLPAIKEDGAPDFPPTCDPEPDERTTGQPLCPQRYPLARLQAIEKRIGLYFWNALFQQRPSPKEGGFFKRAWFEIVDAVPAGARRVRWWDKAASEASGDYTAGVLVARVGDLYYVEDVVRGQWPTGERDKIIRQTAALDKEHYGNTVHIWSEQEPGSAGKDAALAFVTTLAGFIARTEPASGAKDVRAQPLASQAQAGNVKIVRGRWNEPFLAELSDFNLGRHDDQVDAAASAFNKLVSHGLPFGFVKVEKAIP